MTEGPGLTAEAPRHRETSFSACLRAFASPRRIRACFQLPCLKERTCFDAEARRRGVSRSYFSACLGASAPRRSICPPFASPRRIRAPFQLPCLIGRTCFDAEARRRGVSRSYFSACLGVSAPRRSICPPFASPRRICFLPTTVPDRANLFRRGGAEFRGVTSLLVSASRRLAVNLRCHA
jgi:hypothetical protein